MGDPENTLVKGRLWISDDKTTVIERNDDGTTTFHNQRSDDSWRENTSGQRDDED